MSSIGTPSSPSIPGKSTRDIIPSPAPENAMTGYSKRPAMNHALRASRTEGDAYMRWYSVIATTQIGAIVMNQFTKVRASTFVRLRCEGGRASTRPCHPPTSCRVKGSRGRAAPP